VFPEKKTACAEIFQILRESEADFKKQESFLGKLRRKSGKLENPRTIFQILQESGADFRKQGGFSKDLEATSKNKTDSPGIRQLALQDGESCDFRFSAAGGRFRHRAGRGP
jgi:hypothetical protein